jgi:glycosyltransferase involved in cell wall biosynthesis
MIKILQVLLDNRVGGISTRLLDAAKPLKDLGVEISLAVPSEPGGLDEICSRAGIEVHRLCIGRPSPRSLSRNLNWLLTFIRSVAELKSVIAKEGYDVVQVNGFACFQGAIAARLLGRPVVWLMANTMYPKWIVRPLMPAIRSRSHVVSISPLVHQYFCGSKVPAVDESVIFEPVDVSKADKVLDGSSDDNDVRREFCIGSEDKILINVANITPAKGHSDLLRAFAKVKQSIPKVKLLIVGAVFETQIEYSRSLHDLARNLGVEDSVIWTGARNDVFRLVSASDIFVMASHNEGTPIAILEAMALRKLVISTAVGGTPDQIENGVSGVLVPAKEPDQLAEMIVRYLSAHAERQKIADMGRRRVEETFSLDLHAKRYADLYKRLVTACRKV